MIGNGAGACELINARRGSVLASHVEPAFDSKARKKGLLGRESIPGDYALIIAPCSSIHTFFMRCPIDAVFVSKNGTVTKTCRGVKPWRIAGSLKAFAVVEAAQGFIARYDIAPGEIVALREAANGQPAGAQATRAPAAKPGETAARDGSSHKRVTLADLVASKTALAWFESVAVVQELCEAVEACGPAGEPRVPELKHIALTAEGSVTLLAGGPAGHSPVHRAALVLLALTPEGQLPVRLRLLVLEEASAKPRLRSLPELRRELEFFERPDRRRIVAEIHELLERLADSGVSAPPVPPLVLEPPQKRPHRRWNRRHVAAWALIAMMAAAAVAGVWAWPRAEGQALRNAASQMTSTATGLAKLGIDAARRELGDLGWRLGLAPKAQRLAEPPPAAPKPDRAAQPAGPPPDALADRQPALLQVPQGTLLPAEVAPAPGPPPASVPTDSARVGILAPQADGPAGGVREAQRGTAVVYSAADVDVVPPRLVRPAQPSGAADAEASLDVEIVVSPAGEVESVKLLSPSTGSAAAMTLSAIKTWSFEPATRNGAPVSYRHRMKLRRH